MPSPLNPALADAYRKIVVTTSTGSGGLPGTTTAQAVDAELNLDAGFGISLVTDVINNKVTIVNTGNGTGALTTITESNSNGTFYPIFTRPPPVTLTFTAGVDFVTAQSPAGITEVRITGTSNVPSSVDGELLAMLTGMIPGETFQGVQISDSSTVNFTVARAPAVTVTGATVIGNGTTATVSYTVPTFAPFFAGQQIAISGFSDAGFNSASATILTCTKTELTYSNPTTGTATGGVLTALHSNSYPAFYDTDLGCWRITVISSTGVTEGLSSLTISTGAGQINPDTGTYQMDTMYLDTTSTPLTYNPSAGTLTVDNISGVSFIMSGHVTLEGVTSTGATGTGKFVFDNAPTITGHPTIEGVTSTGATGTGKFVFDASPSVSNLTDTGHPTIEGVTSTGATGTGKFVFDNSPTITGHPTVEGVTSTGATGTGKFVFDNAPTISGHPTIEGVTSTGATGTGKFVFDNAPTFSGHITLEGQTLTGVTGTGKLVLDNAPTISGHPTIEGVTSTGATGTGNFVFDTSPTLVTPILGTPQSGNFSTGTFTWPTFNQNTTGYAANLSGGNNTTLLGSVHYQSDLNVTTQLAPNTTTTKKFLRQTGDGTNGAVPAWDTVTATDVGLGNVTNESKATMFTSPTFTGNPTIGSVTTTGTTGTGKFVFDTSPTIAGGSISGLTTLGIRDTSAAFDVTVAAVSSTALTAGRTLTLDVVNSARTVKLAGNIDIANNLTTAGNFALTLTTTNTTNVTLPTGTVTLYGTGSGTITSSQLATSLSDETGSGSVVFGTNPSITSPSYSNGSNTADADLTVDASLHSLYFWSASFTTTRNLNISNLTAGRKVMIYVRNTNGTARALNVLASTTTTGFAAVNLATGPGVTSSTSITLSLTSGTAVITVFNANGNLVGSA